jgi:Domain of unknown function (DUF4349)
MKSTSLLAAAMLLSFLIACKEKAESKMDAMTLTSIKEETASDDKVPDYATDSTASPDQVQKTKNGNKSDNPKTDWDKKIIKNATLELEVKEGNMYYKSLREQVKSLGGYIAQEEQTASDYKLENRIVIKVPVDQFDQALADFSEKAEKIQQRKISSEDVTGEIVDTRSRMETKKQVRLRYLELLNQARTMPDILSVQSEINGIQQEIESAAGRVQWLGHAAAYSTINLTYFQVLNEKAKNDNTPSFGSRLLHSFKNGGQWFLELLIGLVAIWPLLLGGVVAVVVGKRYFRKKAVVG